MALLPFIILFIGGVVLTVGDLVFKVWVERGMGYSILYILGTFIYVIGSLLLVESYKYDVNIGIAGMIQVIFNTTILIIFTFFYFHEPLTTRQIFGVLLGFVALYLVK